MNKNYISNIGKVAECFLSQFGIACSVVLAAIMAGFLGMIIPMWLIDISEKIGGNIGTVLILMSFVITVPCIVCAILLIIILASKLSAKTNENGEFIFDAQGWPRQCTIALGLTFIIYGSFLAWQILL